MASFCEFQNTKIQHMQPSGLQQRRPCWPSSIDDCSYPAGPERCCTTCSRSQTVRPNNPSTSSSEWLHQNDAAILMQPVQMMTEMTHVEKLQSTQDQAKRSQT